MIGRFRLLIAGPFGIKRAAQWQFALPPVLLVLLLGSALAQPAVVPSDSPRRTPVVALFEQWRDAVVYVAGPQIDPHARTLQEFFQTGEGVPPRDTLGTGFVLHSSGYVLTNAHAVESMVECRVTLSDGKTYPAEVVAVVHQQDLALLKIEPPAPLKAVRLARSGDVLIGEPLVVIGNPHGLLSTCTCGILSAVGRATRPSGLPGVVLQNLIQTDAGINPGSSGGPWINAVGEVAGITVSKKDNSDNIGFAVPAASIRQELPGMLDLEQRVGFTTGLTWSSEPAARVTAVAPESPAAAAGVQPGDLIVEMAGVPVADAADAHLALIGRSAGETLPLKLQRDQEPIAAVLALGTRPPLDAAAVLWERLGLKVSPLSAEQGQAMRLRLPRGVVVAEVEPTRYAGVETPPRAGDVLARIGWIRPRNPHHAAQLLNRMPKEQPIHAVLLRSDGTTSTRIDLTAAPAAKGENP